LNFGYALGIKTEAKSMVNRTSL